jgi:hypothetical protein
VYRGQARVGNNVIETIINKSEMVKDLKNKAKDKELNPTPPARFIRLWHRKSLYVLTCIQVIQEVRLRSLEGRPHSQLSSPGRQPSKAAISLAKFR